MSSSDLLLGRTASRGVYCERSESKERSKMVFCTNCGNAMDQAATVCPRCGTAVPAQAAPSGAAAPGAPAASAGGGLGTVAKVLAVVVGIVLIVAMAAVYFGLRFARHIRVEHDGEVARVHGPFGTVESGMSSEEVARQLEVEVYPGAEGMDGAALVKMGNMSTGTAEFETSDPVTKVAEFYQKAYRDAKVASRDGDRFVLVRNEGGAQTTVIVAEGHGSRTRIKINRTSRGDGDLPEIPEAPEPPKTPKPEME